MVMAAITKFRQEVLMEINCPVAMVDHYIRRAAIEFCDYTLTWREQLDPHVTWKGAQSIDIDLPVQSRLSAVLYVGHDGVKVEQATEAVLDDRVDGWRSSVNQSAMSQYFYLPDRSKIRLALSPSSTTALTIVAALKPSQDASKLPEELYEDHLEAIAHGAKARLLAMPKKPWSDLQLAGMHKQLFDEAKSKEKAERLNDYTRESSLTIRPVNYYG